MDGCIRDGVVYAAEAGRRAARSELRFRRRQRDGRVGRFPTEFDSTHEEPGPPLLLHSLAEFRELILLCLEASGARRVVEIGSEEGTFTRQLLAWAEDVDAIVYCVDPAPTPALIEVAASSPRINLVLQRSLEALEHLEPCDVYFVDGDHNYYTVHQELRAIGSRVQDRAGYPLVFLHDVGWPAGRRDMYYSPDAIPAGERHEHTYDRGTLPWRSDLVEGGFRGEGSFAWALAEGGPRNGVLAAVEDFIADRSDLRILTVPCIFGLGVLYDRGAPYAGDIAAILGRYDGDVLLRRLEENRLRLYLRVLEMQDDLIQVHREFEKSLLHVRDVQVENRALWGRVAELEDQLRSVSVRHDQLVEEVRSVLRARSIDAAEWISRVHGRLRHRPSLSSARLRALVDEGTE